MAKVKIQKGLTDKDMFRGMEGEANFESQMLDAEEKARKEKLNAKVYVSPQKKQDAFFKEFISDTVETQLGKLLYDIKMEYFRDGVSDYSIQVKKQGKHILIETTPKKFR